MTKQSNGDEIIMKILLKQGFSCKSKSNQRVLNFIFRIPQVYHLVYEVTSKIGSHQRLRINFSYRSKEYVARSVCLPRSLSKMIWNRTVWWTLSCIRTKHFLLVRWGVNFWLIHLNLIDKFQFYLPSLFFSPTSCDIRTIRLPFTNSILYNLNRVKVCGYLVNFPLDTFDPSHLLRSLTSDKLYVN